MWNSLFSLALLAGVVVGPVSAALTSGGWPAEYPLFTNVQILVDGKARRIPDNIAKHIELESLPKDNVIRPATSRDLSRLKRKVIPEAARVYRRPSLPRWLKFNPPKIARAIEFPGALDTAYNNGNFTSASLKSLVTFIKFLDKAIPDKNTLPIFIANSHLYSSGKHLKKKKYPDYGGNAYPKSSLLLLKKLTGQEIPIRPFIILSNDSYDASVLTYPRYLRNLIAHEIGHVIGLDHQRKPRNIMHPNSSNARLTLNKPQIKWILRWLKTHSKI